MTRETTDGLYIELGYYEPEQYFTYVAEGTTLTSAVIDEVWDSMITWNTLNTWDDLFVESTTTIASVFTLEIKLGQLQLGEAELLAEAEYLVILSRIRDGNIEADAAFDIDIDYTVIVEATSDVSSEFTLVAAADIISNAEAECLSEFALECQGGYLIEAEVICSSEFNLTAEGRIALLDTRVYIVPREERSHVIGCCESRVFIIEKECRTLIIRKK